MVRSARFLLIALLGLGAAPYRLCAAERPPAGFLTGPYLQLSVGARQSGGDTNLVSGTAVGHATSSAYGFHFGWHIEDHWGVDFSGHYTSGSTGTTQQHIAILRMCGLWNPLLTPLVHSPRARLLPFLVGGLAGQVNVMPAGDPATIPRLTQWSAGPSGGAGLALLTHRDQMYFSVRGTLDLLYHTTASQEIAGTLMPVYAGGWRTQWSAVTGIGLHF